VIWTSQAEAWQKLFLSGVVEHSLLAGFDTPFDSSGWTGKIGPWAAYRVNADHVAGAVLPLTDGDSAFYATVARDALRAGEWIVFSTRDGGVFDKPPLTTWFLELSLAAFGSADWAVRLWHVGLAVATVLVTYHLARLILSPDQSLLAALILLTSGQFFYQSLVPQQDVPVTLFVTLGLYLYLRWLRDAQWQMAALEALPLSPCSLKVYLERSCP
jgi:hypothetical protein